MMPYRTSAKPCADTPPVHDDMVTRLLLGALTSTVCYLIGVGVGWLLFGT